MAFKMKNEGIKKIVGELRKASKTHAGQADRLESMSAMKMKDEDKYTTAGKPKLLYNADGDTVKTNNIDEGALSKIKTESGTGRKYVEYTEGPKEGGRLYLSNPK